MRPLFLKEVFILFYKCAFAIVTLVNVAFYAWASRLIDERYDWVNAAKVGFASILFNLLYGFLTAFIAFFI